MTGFLCSLRLTDSSKVCVGSAILPRIDSNVRIVLEVIQRLQPKKGMQFGWAHGSRNVYVQ
jgi:hypothetical protein